MFPEPGGIASLLLLFPIIFFGSRMAEASPIEKTHSRRIRTGFVLGICVLLMAILPLLGPIALLVVLFYGILCAIQIMRRGEGGKRFLIGTVVIAFTFFALADYAASFAGHGTHLAANESSAVGTLRSLFSAEEKFRDSTGTELAKEPRYGSMEDLRNKKLIDSGLQVGIPRSGYVFREVVDPGRKQFLYYAVPEHLPPSRSEPGWAHFLPGLSLYFNVLRRDKSHGTGTRSFAVDETGTVRFTASPIAPPVQREAAEHWGAL